MKIKMCHICGCTENRACFEGCSWASPGICTRCADVPESFLRGREPRYQTFTRQGLIQECRMLKEGLHRLTRESNTLHLIHHRAMESHEMDCSMCDLLTTKKQPKPLTA